MGNVISWINSNLAEDERQGEARKENQPQSIWGSLFWRSEMSEGSNRRSYDKHIGTNDAGYFDIPDRLSRYKEVSEAILCPKIVLGVTTTTVSFCTVLPELSKLIRATKGNGVLNS